jgi:hypothetical protein
VISQGEENGCDGDCQTTVDLSSNQCVARPDIGSCGADGDHLRFKAVAASVAPWVGACTPSVQEAALPEPTWEATARVCGATPGEGCESGTLCAPPAPPGFTQTMCIGHEGDVPCPSDHPSRTVVHRGVLDGRGCTDCACSSVACSGTIQLFDRASCEDDHLKAELATPFQGMCERFANEEPSVRFLAGPASCAPSGGVPGGELLPDDPFTVCCTE